MNRAQLIIPEFARALLAFSLVLISPVHLFAGGSGLNVVVVVNQNSSNSLELANYFREKRAIPPENILRVAWPGDAITWTANEFSTVLVNPILDMLASRGLTNQIDYLALSMDFPFRTTWNGSPNSTTAALFYGLKGNSAGDPAMLNSYAGSEAAFSQTKPSTAPPFSFLTTLLTSDTLESAREMVAQGVGGTGTFPVQPVVLAKSSDGNRNFRSAYFDNAIFNSTILGGPVIGRTNSDQPAGLTGLLGYQTGLAQYEVSPGTFSPGAIADNVTSFGGIIFGPNDQTSLLEFIRAGAAGSYGTVSEPLADPDKFPNPMVYFYQARGFSLAESYYQSVSKPYLGLVVGEPLSAPFAARGQVSWSMVASNAALRGQKTLGLRFTAHDATRPLQQIDLFIDGRWYRTLTNLAPSAGNRMTVALNGFPVTYVVPTNATITSIAAELAGLINNPQVTNATAVQATVVGDRIELQTANTNLMSFPYYLADDSGGATNVFNYRVRYLPDAFPPRMIPVGVDNLGRYQMLMEIPSPLGHVVQASTNLVDWLPIFTNTTPGLIDFRDSETAKYARRFYQIIGPKANLAPTVSIKSATNGTSLSVRVESQLGQPYALLVSTNLVNWIPAVTNLTGGVLNYVEDELPSRPDRFYRALLVPPPQPLSSVTDLSPTTALVRVENAVRPFVVERSTDGLHWSGLVTNFALRDIQVDTTNAIGTAGALTTRLHASRPALLASQACGVQSYTFFAATLTAGAWVQFEFSTTNQTTILVSATNMIPGVSVANLALDLVNRLNSEPALQGADGVVAEDFFVNAGGQPKFTLRARSPGARAAQLGVLPKVSGFATGVSIAPATYRKLTKNLGDLASRNHLYVAAGLTSLDLQFSLDTTTLPDGFHTLTAVAYEGTSVRSQTHGIVNVQVQNSALAADLTVTSQTNIFDITNTLHIAVTANTNSVGTILLYSTGGLLAGTTNQTLANFSVNASLLGVGTHPFYALVTTTNGLRYRTATRNLTLVRP